MSEFVRAASTTEIPPGASKIVNVGAVAVAIFHVDGAFHAINNTCVHRGGPLGEGEVEQGAVTCPWHAWKFDVRTGECTNRPGTRVAVHEVRVEGQDVLVKV